MKCKYYKEKGCCSKGNDPIDKSQMGDCIYKDGVITEKASIHCSEGKKQMENKFPILGSEPKEYIPLGIVKLHEKQALENHGQTLKRLAERGGLSWIEALCILEDREYDYNLSEIDAKIEVFKIIEKFSIDG